jgi:hypothetical protein
MAMANATCTADEGQNVTSIGACDLGGLTFSNFTVSGTPNPPGTTVFLSSVGTGTSAGEVDLGFQLATPWNGTSVTAADTILMYTVTGPGNIVGVDNAQSGGAGVVIQEIVCSVAFVNGQCSAQNQLTNFSNPPNNSGSFSAQSTIYILKDISQNGPNASISGFVNSHETSSVPEPASLSMMGLGLLGLGLVGRRKRKV